MTSKDAEMTLICRNNIAALTIPLPEGFKPYKMKKSELSKRVKELRTRKGLSQEQLADQAQLSLRTIQRLETGETEPRGDTLKRLAQALDVAPDDLIDWALIEDKSFILTLNALALGGLVFPLLGVLLPLILWIMKKDKIKNVYKAGTEILNFQITWNILIFLGPMIMTILMVSSFDQIQASGNITPEEVSSDMTINVAFILIYYSLLYGYNIVLILTNMIRGKQGKSIKYLPKVNFIK